MLGKLPKAQCYGEEYSRTCPNQLNAKNNAQHSNAMQNEKVFCENQPATPSVQSFFK